MIRVGIVEGHPLLAQAWSDVISQSADLATAWIACTVGEAKDAMTRHVPDIVLLGIDVPGRHELEAPNLPLAVSLTLRSGPMTAESLRQALLATAAGPRSAAVPRGAAGVLSTRERQVMVLIALGKTNRESAETLGISPKTIETHRSHALKKLGLRNNAQLIRFAIEHGYANI